VNNLPKVVMPLGPRHTHTNWSDCSMSTTKVVGKNDKSTVILVAHLKLK